MIFLIRFKYYFEHPCIKFSNFLMRHQFINIKKNKNKLTNYNRK